MGAGSRSSGAAYTSSKGLDRLDRIRSAAARAARSWTLVSQVGVAGDETDELSGVDVAPGNALDRRQAAMRWTGGLVRSMGPAAVSA